MFAYGSSNDESCKILNGLYHTCTCAAHWASIGPLTHPLNWTRLPTTRRPEQTNPQCRRPAHENSKLFLFSQSAISFETKQSENTQHARISPSAAMAGRFGFSSSSQPTMKVTSTPSTELALTNLAYVSSSDLPNFAVPGSKLFLALIGNSFVLSLRYPFHIQSNFLFAHKVVTFFVYGNRIWLNFDKFFYALVFYNLIHCIWIPVVWYELRTWFFFEFFRIYVCIYICIDVLEFLLTEKILLIQA